MAPNVLGDIMRFLDDGLPPPLWFNQTLTVFTPKGGGRGGYEGVTRQGARESSESWIQACW